MKQLILTILLFSVLTSSGKERDIETRTATMTVPIEDSQNLILNMKNTELRIETWDKDEVFIEATVKMNSSLTEKRAELLNNWQALVESGVSKSSFGVKINSALEETKEVNKKTFLGMVVSVNINIDKAYDISYSIKVPGTNTLKIEGSYEDVSLIGDFDELELDLYSADFEADNLILADLELKYGSATVKNIKSAEITLYENELDAEEITSLKLETKYSEVEIKTVGALDLDSYETDFVFGSTLGIEGSIKYGQLEVTGKTKQLEVELYEVDIEAGEVEKVRMRSKYSSLTSDAVGSLLLESSYEDEFEIEVLGSLESVETKYGEYRIGELTQSFEIEGYEDNVWIDAVTDNTTEISLKGKYVETEINLGDTPTFLAVDATYGDFSFDRSAMDVSRMIQEGNRKEIEAKTRGMGDSGLRIEVTGYEMDLDLN